jgi:Putative peptidoglycan binding domain/N-acetylmuramoyl-L-alanine amidase
LAQLCLGRDGTFYIVAAGRCNHAGRGKWRGITTGNSSFIGIEAENTGETSGPRADPWPEVQLDAYRRGVAAILKKIGTDAKMCCGHKEYALPKGRKDDPSFDMNAFRDQVAAVMGGTAPVRPPIPASDRQNRPTLRRGARGELVKVIQRKVNTDVDGIFGPLTEAAVRRFQEAHDLVPDGIVGPLTWAEIDRAPDVTVPSEPVPGTGPINDIVRIAARSDIARFHWNNRGIAPMGYIKGMALVFARVICKLKEGDAAALDMAKANTGDTNRDALAWYDNVFTAAGMNNDVAGADTLRHLFVLLIGLGMRESSGTYCEGRDRSAHNTSANNAEAGLFQLSFDGMLRHSAMPAILENYRANPASGFLDIFKEGARCSAASHENFGSGPGREFQQLSKECPALAAELAAVGLRHNRRHWGPINRREAEVRPVCDLMLRQVQAFVDAHPDIAEVLV